VTGGEPGGIEERLGGSPTMGVSATCSTDGIDEVPWAPACGEAPEAGGLGVGFD
jgi:hypothetical protein